MDGVFLGWTALLWLTAVTEGLQVMVPEKKKVAMLFQSVVLRCHFSTSSTQPAVVQWKFKSYCQDRMGEALGVVSAGLQAVSKRNLEWDPYLDCVDSRRTVRIVASKQGPSVTVGEFYKGRDVTILHDADLHIGKLMWGDSGLYYCLIITPDDVEGKTEESVELLVLGRTGLLADLLPSFAVEIMPEWVFVGLVILGVFLFFLLVGICWCQCCPHSCCCYVRCPCCPDTCCCPRALYEAGKAAKAGYPSTVTSIPGPYYIPSVHSAAGVPSHAVLMEKSHLPPLAASESSAGGQSVRKGYRIQADKERDSMKVLYYVEKELAQFDPSRRMRERYNNTISELSSLHEEDANFRQSYRQVRRKPLPPSGDMDGDAEYWAGVINGGGTSRPQTCSDYRAERGSLRLSQQRCKSEMLSRKSFSMGVPAVSMDELAAFAESYSQHVCRTEGPQEPRRFERTGSRGVRGGAVQHPENSSDEYYGKHRAGNREPLTDSDRGWTYSPPRRRAHEEKHLPRLVCRTPGGSQKYDHSYLTSALERKSRSYDEGGDHGGTPSKFSSQSSQRGGTYYAWSPPSTYKPGQQQQQQQQQPPQQEEGEDTLPPYSERELSRGPSYRSREQPSLNNSDKKRKKEPKKTNEFPTRMSLVV
ncbi:immunoglobulin-like domain-containing receptor 2 isoform X2 [Podarcis raffonei]|uniref:immunoglobulin-like domain-containing receptor 2 isoform X2 n=1 Tax=Podarcis raffonei TaxID=65483 RepID=UPI0023298D95|nr:immunoglobulin-like domain-containing receptor 2 isoform X2 [Podarcis raffonei]